MSARIWQRLTMLAAGLLFALPLLFMLSVSLHPEGEGLGANAFEFPADPRFNNYAAALERMGDFPRYLWNTVLITVLSIAGQLLTCSLAGYAFARLRFRGRDVLFLAVLGGAPCFIFLFRQYFLALPPELDEAARIDGCTPLQAYRHIFLPLAKPMLVTVAIFTFLATWNDFWAPLIYVLSPEKRTLTLALAGFNRTYNTSVEHMMAAAGVVLFPCMLVYFLAQRIFLRGVQVAAGKG